jgi:hypothetical protein
MNDWSPVILFWGVIYVLVSYVPDSTWVNAIWYGIKYQVAFTQVQTNDKPSDCDWTHSPLGNKGCHYKAAVSSYNDAGELIAVDDAMPKHAHSKNGEPIVSYDGGKTWNWDTPATRIKNVIVAWVKVSE